MMDSLYAVVEVSSLMHRKIEQGGKKSGSMAAPMKWILPVVLCALSACGAQPASSPKGKRVAPGVLAIGRISNPRITESSGVVVSRKDPNVLWTHNDGGGKR